MIRNRQTLKESFRQGTKPGEEDFENLIDSSINILDDGMAKTPGGGLKLAPLTEGGTVLSVLENIEDSQPLWEMALNEKGELEIRRPSSSSAAVTLATDGSIVLGEEGQPAVMRTGGRMPQREGCLYAGKAPADGKWHDITGLVEEGCLLEVAAVAGNKDTFRRSSLLATAAFCFGKHSKIRKTRAYKGCFRRKILLRWQPDENDFESARLQIRTRCDFTEGAQISYRVMGIGV
jgi:hypothetical protein